VVPVVGFEPTRNKDDCGFTDRYPS